VPLGEVLSGSRRRPDGVTLTWRFTSPRRPVAEGVVPFFIDWGESPHPGRTSPPGATLDDLRAEHPDAGAVREMLRHLNIEMSVVESATPALKATIRGPRGTVELQ
jgi:hypothetical protein